uniref:MARVEL domain-containing protein n=1 Tax=Glossina brevipalpis TaxID=37001 RepID=A0A1A9WL72_9MUSC
MSTTFKYDASYLKSISGILKISCLCEYYLHVFLAVACFIAASTTISLDVTAYTIATFFALLAFSFYALDAYLGYRLSHQRDAQTQTEPQTV